MVRHALAGVTAPVVTVLGADGRPNGEAARPLLAALADAGVDALLLLGSNGEGALLPADLTADYLPKVTAIWRELRPEGAVTINVSAPGTTEMLRRAELALRAGPDALLVTPPSYFRHRADEIDMHLRSIEQFGHPWAIYNVPKYACELTPEVLEGLLDAPHLIGLKDSSGDPVVLEAFLRVLAGRDDLVVSQGDERNLLGGLQAGARGIVPGLANLVPALVVALFRDFLAGDLAAASVAQERATELTAIHGIRPGVPTVKAVLHDRGVLAHPRCAPPLAAVTPAQLNEIRAFLAPYEAWLVPRP